eukprot:GHUV01037650.1.p4 GENE.GHUV01037650.1~~GHUV01037650.1.p4  ORF type:complete len:102 (-),score=8.26 GHUV01037650.1:191-496(-)
MIETAWGNSWGAKLLACCITFSTSLPFRLGTCNWTLNAAVRPIWSRTSPELLVPMTNSLRPAGGCFFTRTGSTCTHHQQWGQQTRVALVNVGIGRDQSNCL